LVPFPFFVEMAARTHPPPNTVITAADGVGGPSRSKGPE
jgi:hypothetical protein